MCGIAGFVLGAPIDSAAAVLAEMTDSLIHRGPDGSGHWTDDAGRVFLGHRRLAVIDLSENGAQPMRSRSGRYVITFNGEVYNFVDLRSQLVSLGHSFRGHSDTEVMLAAFEEWGIANAVPRFIGMFAFALWDGAERELYLVRDRIGKKPLYYARAGGSLLFGSELKSLRVFPGFDRAINRDAVGLYLRHNYVPAPECIFSSAQKLKAGTIARFDCRDVPILVNEHRYWQPSTCYRRRAEQPYVGGFEEAVRDFEDLVTDAVKMRMIADVPLGAFLSGGIDSSLVAALMTRTGSGPAKTFTIGFHDDDMNEAKYAKRVAQHLGTSHTEMYLSGEEAMAVIPQLPVIYDEPFADSSQIPTFLVSRVAREHVTVALSGDGGDELACGYDRYLWMQTLWRLIQYVPLPLRRVASLALRHGGASGVDSVLKMLGSLSRGRIREAQVRNRLLKLGEALKEGSPRGIYRQLLSHWRDPTEIVVGLGRPLRDVAATVTDGALACVIESAMTTDTENYLPDDVLVKVDRASMATSLEVRAPLLDHRLFEFSRSLPWSMHVRDKQGKQLLRAILRKHIPDTLVDRPKMGFGIPLAGWLRGPLKDWAEDLLSIGRLERDGILKPDPIRRVWTDFQAGKSHSHYLLWDVLMFQAWLDEENRAWAGTPTLRHR